MKINEKKKKKIARENWNERKTGQSVANMHIDLNPHKELSSKSIYAIFVHEFKFVLQ